MITRRSRLLASLVCLVCTACTSYPTASPAADDFQRPTDHEEWRALQEAAGPNGPVVGTWYPVEEEGAFASRDVLELRADGTFRRGDYRMFPPVFDPEAVNGLRASCRIGAYLVVGDRLQFHDQGQDMGPQSSPGLNATHSQSFTLVAGRLRLGAVEGEPTPLKDQPGKTACLPGLPPAVYSRTAHLTQ